MNAGRRGRLVKHKRISLIIGGIMASYFLALLLNQAVISTMHFLIPGYGYDEYLWFQFHSMGFAILYTLYILLVLTYITYYPRISEIQKIPGRYDWPRISIIIPAYNEELNLPIVLKALKRLDYPRDKMEVIVVDDGSTDDTARVAEKHGVRVVRHEKNMGRGAAVMTGIREARGEIIVVLDADTKPREDSVKHIVYKLHSVDGLGGVCGRLVPVSSGSRLLGTGQKIEYLLGYAYTKTLRSTMGLMLIPSGAFSAFKKRLVEGIDVSDTLAEDFDLGLSIIERGYRLGYVKEAVAETLAPGSLKDFVSQRVRWSAGGLQVLAKHRHLMLNPSKGIVGLLGIPIHFVLGYVVSIMEFFGYIFMTALLVTGVISSYLGAVLVLWLLLLKLYSIMLLIPSMIYSRRVLGSKVRAVEVTIYWFIYYYLLLYTVVKGVYVYLTKHRIGWRTA